MDILQPLPIEKLNLLRLFERDWPIYANYYYLINNAIKWKKKDPEFKLQFFCPNGDVDSGVFVGISTQTWYVVYIFAFEEAKNLLRQALTETNVIQWNKFIQFAAVLPHNDDILQDFIAKEGESKSITRTVRNVTYVYFKPKEECLQLKVLIPDECELRQLDESHIEYVHSVWPHRSIEEPKKSTEFLALMVRLNRGVGLFLKKDNSLVSWVLHTDWGGLGMLQTAEGHKQKGYAKIVVKAIMKQLAEEENLDSFAYAVDKNKPPHELFKSLGYKRITTAAWHFTEPKAISH